MVIAYLINPKSKGLDNPLLETKEERKKPREPLSIDDLASQGIEHRNLPFAEYSPFLHGEPYLALAKFQKDLKDNPEDAKSLSEEVSTRLQTIYSPVVGMLKKELIFPHGDSIHLPPGHTALPIALAKFDKAHTHNGPEIRYMLGPGIFDIAFDTFVFPDENDRIRYMMPPRKSLDEEPTYHHVIRWARLHVERDDYLVIPATNGVSKVHRFFGYEKKGIEAIRLFHDATWTPNYTQRNTPTGK